MWLNLIDDETLRSTEFIYNLSYGKDSMAGLHAAIDILGIPVSRIVHAEVWATDTIPADLPPMVEFKAKADAYIKERWGLTVEHVYATRGGVPRTYAGTFYELHTRGKHIGQLRGFPMQRGSWCKDRLKWSGLDQRKADLREIVLPHPQTEEPRQSKSGGGYTGWPYQQGGWCHKLKERAKERLPDILGTVVQLRSQESSHTAFRSAATTEETGAPSSKPNLFQKPPATRGKEKYRASTG